LLKTIKPSLLAAPELWCSRFLLHQRSLSLWSTRADKVFCFYGDGGSLQFFLVDRTCRYDGTIGLFTL